MSEKITQLIQQIETETKKSEGYLHIDIKSEQAGYNTLIEGNPQGLRLLAVELLKHSLEVEKGHFDIADLVQHEWSINKTIPVSIVGLTGNRDQIMNDKKEEEDKIKKESRFDGWGCLLVLFVVLFFVVYGLVSLIKLFF